ncbi:hypothetical protein PTRA_a0438 [Pseudoalteromonas translucida KMM 520]|uniref:Polysaccharide biosynthesis protein C-terminal domain-containing protein n=1 Tax=Pseudoalteromonas translucida KMM 520 TaxID=1315283 RepID=A0A0U2MMF0_9GAMM|nr:oligosaccharide flippase family protein [Pseudoalteromonas translucida]ALS31796.1 hypothetical protein PTRA_a0438 [Pseudoalteromonas translucida KMM 520]
MVVNTIFAFFIKVLSAAISFLGNMLVTRSLSLESSGGYFIALSVVTFLTPFCALGMNNYMLREVATGSAKRTDTLILNSICISFALGGLGAIFISLFANQITSTLFNVSSLGKTLSLFAFALPFFVTSILISHILQGFGYLKKALFLSGPLLYTFLIVLILTFKPDNNIDIAFFYLSSCICVFLISIYQIKGSLKGTKLLSKRITRVLINKSKNLMVVEVLAVITLTLTTFYLAFFSNSKEVAIFSVAVKISTLVAFVLFALNRVSAHSFSKLYYEKNIIKLRENYFKFLLFSVVLCLPFLFFLLLYPSFFLNFFGGEFKQGKVVLQILALSQLFVVCSGTSIYLLIMTGLDAHHRRNILVSFIISAAIGAPLVNYLGGTGAAIMILTNNCILFFLTIFSVFNSKVLSFNGKA